VKDSQRVFALFARLPALGQVKTRLTPPFTPEEALALHVALLGDSLDLLGKGAAAAGAAGRLYLSEGDLSGTGVAVPEDCEPRRQEGSDLGERLRRAFQETLEAGARQMVVIGSDCPHLPVAWVARAFEALDRQDLVIGPARDGGYYLLGAGRVHPFLFEGIPWGTAQVYRETVRRARRQGLAIASLPALDDVDVEESVTRLWSDLSRRQGEGEADLPSRTLALLGEWEKRGRIAGKRESGPA
jgi:rSAM/selenodomain-associated transferase 1